MLCTLELPGRDPVADYETAAKGRRIVTRGILGTLQERVLDAYLEYRSDLGAVPLPPITLTTIEQEALSSNFELTKGSGVLRSLRDAVIAAASAIFGKCPMCGIHTASSIDHYLPRSQYPEYAILVSNLIPICDRCNRLKSNICQHLTGGELFHTYLDDLPDVPLVVAHVKVNPSVTVEYHTPNTGALAASLALQFKVLGLGDLFIAEATGELQTEYETYRTIHSAEGAVGLAAFLSRKSERLARVWGSNHWKTALYVGLTNSSDFIEGGFLYLKQ
jgi:hypothetical protein